MVSFLEVKLIMVNSEKIISAVILCYKPTNKMVLNIDMLLQQTIKLKTILLVCTDRDSLYVNLTNNFRNKLNKYIEEGSVKLKSITREEFNHGATRNYAVNFLDSDYVLFMTDDAVAAHETLVFELVRPFVDEKMAVCYARQLPLDGASFIEKMVRNFNYPNFNIEKSIETKEKLGIKNYFVSNVCAMYSLKIFREIGGFEEGIPLNEDSIYSYNVINRGYKVMYLADAKVFHSHNLSLWGQFIRNYNIGKTQKMKKEIYNNIKSENEGFKLFKYGIKKCIKTYRFLDLIYFVIYCIVRYIGFLMGKIFAR